MYVNFGVNFTAYTHAQMWPVSLVVLTACMCGVRLHMISSVGSYM